MITRALRSSPPSLLFLGLLLGGFFSGCAVGPDYKTPELETPTTWISVKKDQNKDASNSVADAQAQEKALDRWWELFSDPALNELVQLAVGTKDNPKNFDLKIAAARVQEARAQVQVSESAWFPSIDSKASFARSRISRNSLLGASAGGSGGGFSFLPGFTNNLFSFGFDAMWELDFFGKTRRGVEASDALLEATEDNYHQMVLTMVAEIARNYVEYRAADERIEAITRNIKAQDNSLSLTRSRFQAGMTSQLDVFQAEAQLAATEAQRPGLQLARDQARNRLAVLLGEYPGFVEIYFQNHPGKLPEDIGFVPSTLPSQLLRKRPDIRAAERQLAAATAQVGVATAEFFPDFSLSLAGSFQSRESKNWLQWASRSWNLNPQVSLPIFQGGRLVGNLDAANAAQEQAMETYKKAVFSSVEEVENSISAYQQEQIRNKSLARALAANHQSMEISQRLYTEGLADFLRVLEAERSLFSTEDSVIASKAIRVTSLIALFKALGGGWDNPTEQPEVLH